MIVKTFMGSISMQHVPVQQCSHLSRVTSIMLKRFQKQRSQTQYFTLICTVFPSIGANNKISFGYTTSICTKWQKV